MLDRTFALLAVLSLSLAPRAQDRPPSAEALGRSAHDLVQQLAHLDAVDEPNDAQKAEHAEALKALDELAARIEKLEGLTAEHYVRASSPLLEGHAALALRIAKAGLKHFPESRFLCDHAGMAHTQLAVEVPPGATQLTELKAAEQSFRKALPLQPDTVHAHLGLCQVLSLLDQCDEALQQLDIAGKLAEAGEPLPDTGLLRISLLLRSGRAKEALVLLRTPGSAGHDADDAQILTLRACALAGDAAAAQAAITKLSPGPGNLRLLVEAADVLGFLGKKPEALKLLAQRPPRGDFETEEQRIAQLLLQTAAAQEVIWKANDFSPKGPLRAALTKALGHSYKTVDPSAKPPKETDLSGSPVLIAQMLANKPPSPQKDWANRVLQVLCVRASADHKPTPLETQVRDLTKGQRMPTADDVPALFLAMRRDVGDPDACAALSGLRAVEKLGGGKIVPAKK